MQQLPRLIVLIILLVLIAGALGLLFMVGLWVIVIVLAVALSIRAAFYLKDAWKKFRGNGNAGNSTDMKVRDVEFEIIPPDDSKH